MRLAPAVPAREEPQVRYRPPSEHRSITLRQAIVATGRSLPPDKQFDLLQDEAGAEPQLYYAGDLDLLNRRCVAIVGAREVTQEGARRAYRLARELVGLGAVVMSGLAKGVDTAAHRGAIESRGRTVAVIGTPLAKAYPSENAALQESIYQEHLLLTPFAAGQNVFKSNFPKRNRAMALLSDATVIVEASDTSGSLHQAAECVRSGRWLFIMESVLADARLTWPSKFLGKPKVAPLASTRQLMDALG